MASYTTIDDYIHACPDEVRTILTQLRSTIRAVAPRADEKISYQIPTFAIDGRLVVSFAAWKHHIAVYPVPAADEAFEAELAPYRAAKSTLRFPLNRPIPYELIARVVTRLVDQRTG